jgi:hypothetical protein
MIHIVSKILNNQVSLGILCFLMIIVPILGIAKVHDIKDNGDSTRGPDN